MVSRSDRSGCFGLLAEDLLQRDADLRAHAHPVLQANAIDLGFGHRASRIVGADVLDEAAVARVLGVGHDDVIERVLLRAPACKTNLYHELSSSLEQRAGRAHELDSRPRLRPALRGWSKLPVTL